jgi:hypothetical protein
MQRPSYKELDRKLRNARKLAGQHKILTINPSAVAEDATELGYLIMELPSILIKIIDEIGPQNYVGRRPPEKSYEREIQDLELFAFRWDSVVFGCRAYLKFVINNDVLYVVSLHIDRQR